MSVEIREPWLTPSAAIVWNLRRPRNDAGWRGMAEPYRVSESTQFKADPLWNAEPVEFTQQWGDVLTL